MLRSLKLQTSAWGRLEIKWFSNLWVLSAMLGLVLQMVLIFNCWEYPSSYKDKKKSTNDSPESSGLVMPEVSGTSVFAFVEWGECCSYFVSRVLCLKFFVLRKGNITSIQGGNRKPCHALSESLKLREDTIYIPPHWKPNLEEEGGGCDKVARHLQFTDSIFWLCFHYLFFVVFYFLK